MGNPALVAAMISTHSRAKAAGQWRKQMKKLGAISTHSRAKAAGCSLFPDILACQNFNSQPREGGWFLLTLPFLVFPVFQLTAARRRLALTGCKIYITRHNFNSQPREGGWIQKSPFTTNKTDFNSQPREGGWYAIRSHSRRKAHFNSQPREGGWRWSLQGHSLHMYFNSQPREGGWLSPRVI